MKNRAKSFDKIRAIAEKAEKRWRAEGITDEEMDTMILEEVRAARDEYKAIYEKWEKGNQEKTKKLKDRLLLGVWEQ